MNVVILLAFIIVDHRGAYSKWIKGTLESTYNWEFLTRFCFLTQNGALDYEFKYPVAYGTQEVLLYYDEPGQWNFVYKSGKTCSERLSVLSVASNQIIALNTSDSETSLFSGCQLILQHGSPWYHCKGQRSFRSSRERWWYIAIARCGESKDQVGGLYLQYKIHMTNGEDLLHREYSADEFYILPVDISFFIVYLVMALLSFVCAAVLRRKNLFHTTYKLYLAALFIWTFHLLLKVIAWGYYGNTGLEQGPLEATGRVLQAASTAIFILMLILMAKGYTITRGQLTHASVIKITVFFTLYIVTIVVLFVWEGLFFDPGKVLYYYESPPGYGMTAIHFIAWFWFLYSTAFTMKNSKTKVTFYIPFFGFYTLWFLASPVVTLVAMFAMAKWSRQKTVNGVEQFVSFLGHIVFLALTRPSAANSNFPYHVRTSQVAALVDDHDAATGTSNPYIINTGVVFTGPGPNLELFITSKTGGQVASTNSIHVYSSLGQNISRPSDIPPASYSQALRNDMMLPSAPSGFVNNSNQHNRNNNINGNTFGSTGLPAPLPTASSEVNPHFHVNNSTLLPTQDQPPPDYIELFQANKV